MFTGFIAEVASWLHPRVTPRDNGGGNQRHAPRNHIHRNDVEALAFIGRKLTKVRAQQIRQRPGVLMPSFHPENGERSELSTIDGRTMAIGKSARAARGSTRPNSS